MPRFNMDIPGSKHDEIRIASSTSDETMKDYLLRLHDENVEANRDLQQIFATMDRIKEKVLAGRGQFHNSVSTPEGWKPAK